MTINKKYIDQKVEVYCKTIIKPSPEELKRHSLFLKNEIFVHFVIAKDVGLKQSFNAVG